MSIKAVLFDLELLEYVEKNIKCRTNFIDK